MSVTRHTLAPTTGVTSQVREFDIDIEPDGPYWRASARQAPEWLAIANSRDEIISMAFNGMTFYVNDPLASIIVRYHFPESVT